MVQCWPAVPSGNGLKPGQLCFKQEFLEGVPAVPGTGLKGRTAAKIAQSMEEPGGNLTGSHV